MREHEREAQLAEAVELGRQEERQRNQKAIDDANDSFAALAEANEQGAALVKRVERAQIAGALAEQRRSLEHEINESRLATGHEIAELTHVGDMRHAREIHLLKEQLEAAHKVSANLATKVSELESKLEQTKEGQIAAWQSRSLRRMLNYSLAKGWGAWHELYET